MRMLRKSIPFVASIFLIACGSDPSVPDTDDPETSEIGLAVRAVNTGTVPLDIETHSPHSIDFCYQVHGCQITGGGWSSVNPGHSRQLAQSLPDSAATGVRVNFIVIAGQGRAEVVRGVAYRTSSGGFLEFTAGPVVHTSASFAAGDTVRYMYGTVN